MTINNCFINFRTKNLDEFIINDHLNAMDLKKLAELNGIDLQIRKGWYDLTLELIKDLNQIGWDKKRSHASKRNGHHFIFILHMLMIIPSSV